MLAHLTTIVPLGDGTLQITCTCGWTHQEPRGGKSVTKHKKAAREIAWNHWASQPVGTAGGAP